MADWFNNDWQYRLEIGDTWHKVNVVDNKMYFNGGEV